MSQKSSATEEVRELVAKRREYLEAMNDASFRKTELEDELHAARSTVDRAVRELEDHDLVERVDGAFTITHTGKLLLEQYLDYVDFSDKVFEATSVLNEIDEEIDIPAELFRDAHVNVPEPGFPDAPVVNPHELVANSPYLHGLAPVVLGYFPDNIQDLLSDAEQEVEVIATEDVLNTVRSKFSDEFERVAEFRERFDLYVTTDDIPFALWLIDNDGVERVGVTVYNNTGAAGSVVSANQDAVQWGKEFYQGYLEDAEEVDI